LSEGAPVAVTPVAVVIHWAVITITLVAIVEIPIAPVVLVIILIVIRSVPIVPTVPTVTVTIGVGRRRETYSRSASGWNDFTRTDFHRKKQQNPQNPTSRTLVKNLADMAFSSLFVCILLIL